MDWIHIVELFLFFICWREWFWVFSVLLRLFSIQNRRFPSAWHWHVHELVIFLVIIILSRPIALAQELPCLFRRLQYKPFCLFEKNKSFFDHKSIDKKNSINNRKPHRLNNVCIEKKNIILEITKQSEYNRSVVSMYKCFVHRIHTHVQHTQSKSRRKRTENTKKTSII